MNGDLLRAADPATPTRDLHALAGSNDQWVRKMVAANPSTLERTFFKLMKRNESVVFREMLSNPKVPASVLKELVVRKLPESKKTQPLPSTWAGLMIKLYEVMPGDPILRGGILRNPDVPLCVLYKGMNYKWHNPSYDPSFLYNVLVNPKTPAAYINSLAKDKDVNVREWVAMNVNTSTEVLRELLTDWEKSVRGSALKNFNCPLEASAHLHLERLDSYNADQLVSLEERTSDALTVLKFNAEDFQGVPLSWKLEVIARSAGLK